MKGRNGNKPAIKAAEVKCCLQSVPQRRAWKWIKEGGGSVQSILTARLEYTVGQDASGEKEKKRCKKIWNLYQHIFKHNVKILAELSKWISSMSAVLSLKNLSTVYVKNKIYWSRLHSVSGGLHEKRNIYPWWIEATEQGSQWFCLWQALSEQRNAK